MFCVFVHFFLQCFYWLTLNKLELIGSPKMAIARFFRVYMLIKWFTACLREVVTGGYKFWLSILVFVLFSFPFILYTRISCPLVTPELRIGQATKRTLKSWRVFSKRHPISTVQIVKRRVTFVVDLKQNKPSTHFLLQMHAGLLGILEFLFVSVALVFIAHLAFISVKVKLIHCCIKQWED
jgi:hypothetical protein